VRSEEEDRSQVGPDELAAEVGSQVRDQRRG
jgi:hypothetical protein